MLSVKLTARDDARGCIVNDYEKSDSIIMIIHSSLNLIILI